MTIDDQMSVDTPVTSSVPSPSAGSAISALSRKRKALKAVPLHRCRFPDWSPSAVTALAITPASFDAGLLEFGGHSAERGVLAVGRANGDVELMLWGGQQGWIAWRSLPSPFAVPQHRSTKRPTSLLSHLVFTHQTTLSPSDVEMYDGDAAGAEQEIRRLERQGVRLFGVGGVGSELVEWDWGGPGAAREVGRVKATLPTLPPIFALAASRSGASLAVGCEDSTIRIINILDDELEVVSKIEVGGPGKVRALSLAWGPTVAPNTAAKGKARETSPSGVSLPARFSTPQESFIVAGCSNSSIRRFDVPTSGAVAGVWRGSHRLTVDQLKGEHTVVWALAVLKDRTIVSGDSMGNIKFWDGEMGTQSQSFKSHKADVLCLTIGADGTSVFSSGVDQKTTEFRRVAVGSVKDSKPNSRRWIQSSGRRLHSHDVRAMIVSPPYSMGSSNAGTAKLNVQQVPILTSGGLDLNLIIVPVSPSAVRSTNTRKQVPLKNPVSDVLSTEFETTIHRRASYVPQRSQPFAVARDSRLLVCRRDRGVGIWKLEDPRSVRSGQRSNGDSLFGSRFGGSSEAGQDEEELLDETSGWQKVLDMDLKLQTNLVASAVSSDGKWLAVSDLYETKLFKLQKRGGEIVPKRQKTFSTYLSEALPTSLGTGCSALRFTADSSRLVVATSFGSFIAIIQLPTSRDDDFDVLKVFSQHSERESGRELRGKLATKGHNGDATMNGVKGNGVHHDSDSESNMDDESEEEEQPEIISSASKPALVASMVISTDGRWLASADVERKTCVFDLETLKHHITLPTLSEVPVAMSFLPSAEFEPTLMLALPSNALICFGLVSRRFENWAQPLSSLLSSTLMDIREPVLGITFEPARDESKGQTRKAAEHVAIVWGANWVAKIDLEKLRNADSVTAVRGEKASKLPIRREVDRKRARDEVDDETQTAVKLDIRVSRKYQPLVLFDFVGQGELVAVERTWFDVSKGMVDAFVKSGEFAT